MELRLLRMHLKVRSNKTGCATISRQAREIKVYRSDELNVLKQICFHGTVVRL